MNKLEVRMCPVDELVPYQHNARTHSEEQIARIAGWDLSPNGLYQ